MSMVERVCTFPDTYTYPAVATSAIMDATGERYAYIQQIRVAGNIAKIHAYAAAVSAADDVKVSLQTVDMATGLPSGTVWATKTGNKAYGVTTVSAAGWQTFTFTEAAAVVAGDYVAIVIEWNSYVSGNMRFYLNKDVLFGVWYMPYTLSDNTASPGTWAKSSVYDTLAVNIEYDDGKAYNNGVQLAMSAISGTSISSSTTPDEVGNYFQVPIKMRAYGFWFYGDFDNAVTFSLLNASGTTLANAVYDPDVRGAASYAMHNLYFDSDPASTYTLETGTWYRIIMTPGASAVAYYEIKVQSNAMMGGLDGGINFYKTSRVDGGAWSETTTSRILLGLLVDQFDIGGSGGGGGLPIIGGSVVR